MRTGRLLSNLPRRTTVHYPKLENHMEALVSRECVTEFQTLSYRQAKKIKSLKVELQYIKYTLSEELYKFSAQIEDFKKHKLELEDEYKEKVESNIF